MKRAYFRSGLAAIFLLVLSGCPGSGTLINLDVPAFTPKEEESHEGLKVAVHPFADGFENTGDLGILTHFWGGTTRFTAWNGTLGPGMTKGIIEYLNQSGWQAQLAEETKSGSPDVELWGTIRELTTDAKSGFGNTELEVNTIIEYKAKNLVDGSIERITVGSGGTNTVMWFEPEDMEKLVYTALLANIYELLDKTEVKGRALKRRI